MIMAEMLQLGINKHTSATLSRDKNGLKPWEDTLLPWEDTLLPLQLIAVCIPDAAYN